MTSAAPTETESDPRSGKPRRVGAGGHVGAGEGAVAQTRRALVEVHNLIAFSYLLLMRGMLYLVEPSAEVARRIDLSLVVLVGASLFSALPTEVWARHLPGDRWRRLPGHVYRASFVLILAQSYLMLRELLPILNPTSLDAELLAIDEAIFGVTPALWLERFNVRPVIEWFSAFYFSYFLICATFIFVVLWCTKSLKLVRVFAVGGAFAFFLGQLIYVAVPGFGPVRHMAGQFQGPLDGGFFWSLVATTVQQGGAMKDIFPSLHTALPTFMTLFAFYAAKHDARWEVPARVSAFFAINIIISTMLLRWHYAIDVVAGLALAFGSIALAIWAAPREAHLQRKLGLRSHWDWRDGEREVAAETVPSTST